MKRICFLALQIGVLLVLLTGEVVGGQDGQDREAATLDRDEARNAFEYLNKVRKDPAKFSKEIGVDLSDVKPRKDLKWNDVLAMVAEKKALDMANRDYFGHVTPEGIGINIQIHEAGYKLPSAWIKDKKQNFFESISAGRNTGVEVIQDLILDKDVPDAAHRRHLLGMTDFYAKCTDIGIGFARNPKSKYRTYVGIIIARNR